MYGMQYFKNHHSTLTWTELRKIRSGRRDRIPLVFLFERDF